MEASHPNRFGVLEMGHREVVARRGRAYAAVNIALAEDGLYRQGIELLYSYGGYGAAPSIDEPGFPTLAAAIEAALNELLRHWRTPFPQEPQHVHDELSDLRRQIKARLCQPSLFF